MKENRVISGTVKNRTSLFSIIGMVLLIVSATVGTNAAGSSLIDSVKEFFGKSPVQSSVAPKEEKPLTGSGLGFNALLESSTIGPGNVTTLTYQIINYEPNPVSNIAFSVTLPASVTIANVPNAQSTLQGTLTTPAGGTTITFSGGVLPISGSGQVRVDITGSTNGVHTILSGDLTSSEGNSGTASVDLTVSNSRPVFSVGFAPGSVNLGQRTRLTYTIDNSAGGALNVVSLNFTNNLPTGLVIASPANTSVTGIIDLGSNTLTATPGTNSISYSALGIDFNGFRVLPAGTIGTISVDVVATGSGLLSNTTSPLNVEIGGTNSSVGKASSVLNVTADQVGIQMSFTDDPVPPGGTPNLQFKITNRNRRDSVTGLSFTLDLNSVIPGMVAIGLPQTGVVGAGSTVSGTGVITLTGGNLPPGGSATFNVPLQLPANTTGGKYTFTTSSLTGNLDGSPYVGNPASDDLFVQVAPFLTMSYIDDPVGPGGVAALEFTITNTSSTLAASDIAFNVSLPTVIPDAVTPPTSVCNGGSLTFSPRFTPAPPSQVIPASISVSGANLMAGTNCTFTVNLEVDATAPGGSYPTTTSNITATMNSETVTGQPATDDLAVVSAPALSMSFDDPVLPGSTTTLNFNLQYSENATADATGIGFTVDLNSALSGLAAVGLPQNDVCGTGSQISGTGLISFTGGTLSPGTNCSFSVTVQIPASATTGNVNVSSSSITATVSGNPVTRQGASDTLNISELTTQAVFINSPAVRGSSSLTLQFTINNTSTTADATGIFFFVNPGSALSGLTPNNLPVSDPCGSGSSLFISSGNVFLTGGNLSAGTSCIFDVIFNVPSNAPADTYQLTTSNIQATVGGNAVTLAPMSAQFSVIQPLDLQIAFPDGLATPGGTTTLRFTVSNSHPTAAITNIAFTDNLNASLPGLVATGLPANNVCGAGSQISGTSLLSFTGGSLAPMSSCTFDVTLQIPGGAPAGKVINTTSVPTGDVNGVAVTGDPASGEFSIVNDSDTPVLSYTPIPGTNSTGNQLVRVTITDATGVAGATIFYSFNGGSFNGNTYSSNPCSLTSGSAQNGEWSCTIPGTTNPSAISYYVTATDLVSNSATNPTAGAAVPNLFTVGAGVVPSGNYTNVSLSGGATLAGNINVDSVLRLGGIVNGAGNTGTGGNVNGVGPTLTLGCNATIVGGGPGNYLIGNLAKQFCSPGSFTYPVGTPADGSLKDSGMPISEYSPFSANVTAIGTIPSTLTVNVVDGFLPGSGILQSASRYWDVTETGDLTANISFTYLDQDVNGTEADYKVLRRETTITGIFPGGTINPATNTATALNVTDFSRWAAGNLATTAAAVDIGGRVLNPAGRGISGARVILTGSDGNVVVRRTNPFGYYRFSDIQAGETYVMMVEDKSYSFEGASRVITVEEENLSIDFIATGLN